MSISASFKDQEIFVTGGTGFVGKALIEKLLRSCPALGKIYVLLRPKKGVAIEQRLEDVLNSKLFDRLRREQPQTISKVVPIAGDCMKLGLGISETDLAKLTNVNVVYHSAASVRFDDPLAKAILLNTRATHELVKLALQWKQLKAFIHVSTTYSNPTVIDVEERIYPPYADWRTTIKLAETYDQQTLDIFNLKYSSFQPNSYTFTKSLAEHVANDYRDRLPILIFRPSIVISTLEEPVPGWADNFNGPIGMLVACGVGILRSQNCDPHIVADFVPADVVARALVIAAASYLKKPPAKDQPIDVVNCAVSNISPISMGQVIDIGKRYIRQNPFEKTLWLPGGGITTCPVLHFVRFITMHIMMAIVVDTLLRLSNEKPFLLKLQRRIFAAFQALRVFAVTEWHFSNDNMRALHDHVPKEELATFGFLQHANINYVDFFQNGIRGAKEFLMNESPESSSGARFRMKVFYVLDYLCRAIVYGFLLRLVYRLAVRVFMT
ncbi:PREDICTED: putative fatty acyl-CoA reductase CG5065 [Drosophila arizonae]|uniref:Fatty acyl-CoA reductase n=1 Tax=Drosophila arizonae TaxID=7263 RepID=A0ABM1PXH6_DROAR|nr:PREDICTED: putative fatty acyl-CoA reductase CG5065 [Drosophila arizonae]